MPRGGRGSYEKANDFMGSLKKVFGGMKKWHVVVGIAIVLAAASSIFSLIAPNKLSDITDAITKGITPNMAKITELTEVMSTSLQDKEKLSVKTQEIMTSIDIKEEDKQSFQSFMLALSVMDEKEVQTKFLALPDDILEALLDEVTIDGITIGKDDVVTTMKLIKNVDRENTDAIMKTFDDLPDSVYSLVKPKMDMDYIKGIALFLLILYIVGSILGYIEHFILSTVSNRFAQNLRDQISKKINRLPLKYFDRHEMGDVLSRVTNDVDTIAQHLNNSLATLVSAITLFVGALVMMFYTNWVMAITAIVASFIGFIFMFAILGKSQKYFNQKQIELGKLNGHIEEIYSGHNIVKAYNGEESAKKEFRKLMMKRYHRLDQDLKNAKSIVIVGNHNRNINILKEFLARK